MTPSISDLLSAYYSVYPISGEYAYQGERLSIAAVLRVLIDKSDSQVISVDDILKIVEELEEF